MWLLIRLIMKQLVHPAFVRIVFVWSLMLTASLSYAHIGSPGVVYEGMAGPYRVLVNVQPPDVIPGTAQVSVSVEGNGVSKVTVQPIYWYAGDEGSPEADEAEPVPGMPGQYQGMVWLMENGTASVSVTVEGASGTGKALVPVMAVATAKRDMEPERGWLLGGLGVFLFILMVTIIGASVSDGVTPTGQTMSPRHRRKRVMAMGLAALICGLILFGGSSWWDSWAANYERYMYHPITANSTVVSESGGQKLVFRMDTASLDGRWMSYMIPDHGKLMHMFLVRQGSLDVFAHLHPQRKDTVTFEVALPPVPAGRYLIYADVVRRHGFANTIADTVDIPALRTPVSLTAASPLRRDSEDTYLITNPLKTKEPILADSTAMLCGSPGVKTKLPDGSTIVWEERPNKPLTAGQLYPLKFTVLSPDGKPAQLEPYLGMMGHAAVLRDDGQVFIHLHPTGTYSMASWQVMDQRIAETGTNRPGNPDTRAFRDSIDRVMTQLDAMTEEQRMEWLMPGMKHASDTKAAHPEHEGATVSFPYAFPQAGDYRIWVQVKRDGKILTGAFDAKVVN